MTRIFCRASFLGTHGPQLQRRHKIAAAWVYSYQLVYREACRRQEKRYMADLPYTHISSLLMYAESGKHRCLLVLQQL